MNGIIDLQKPPKQTKCLESIRVGMNRTDSSCRSKANRGISLCKDKLSEFIVIPGSNAAVGGGPGALLDERGALEVQ